MLKPITRIVHDAVGRNKNYSVAQLADILDKRTSTLYNELNPAHSEASTAKLGLDDGLKILELLNDQAANQELALYLGLTAIPVNPKPNAHDLNEDCLQAHHAVSDLTHAATSHPEDVPGKLAAALRELSDIAPRLGLTLGDSGQVFDCGKLKIVYGK